MDSTSSANTSGTATPRDLTKDEVTVVTPQEQLTRIAASKDAFLSQFRVERDMGFTCRFIKTPEFNTIHKIYKTSLEKTITFHFSFPSRIDLSPEWWISFPRFCSGAVKIAFVPSSVSRMRGNRLWIPCKSTVETFDSTTEFKFDNYEVNSAQEMLSFRGYILEPLDPKGPSLEVLKTLVDKFYYSLKVPAQLKISNPVSTLCVLDSHPKLDPKHHAEHAKNIKKSLESKFQEQLHKQSEVIETKYKSLVELVNATVNQAWEEWDTIYQLRQSNFKSKMAAVLKITQDLEQFQKQLKEMSNKVEKTIETAHERKFHYETLASRMKATMDEIMKDLQIYNTAKRLQLKDIQDTEHQSKQQQLTRAQNAVHIEPEANQPNPPPADFVQASPQSNGSGDIWSSGHSGGLDVEDNYSEDSQSSLDEEDSEISSIESIGFTSSEEDSEISSIENISLSSDLSESEISESDLSLLSSDSKSSEDDDDDLSQTDATEDSASSTDDNEEEDDMISCSSGSSADSFVILNSNDFEDSS